MRRSVNRTASTTIALGALVALVTLTTPKTLVAQNSKQLQLPEAARAPVFPADPTAPELQSFKKRVGGSWAMSRNPETGTAHTVFGSGVLVPGARNATPAVLEQAARRFVDDNRALFGVASRDLDVLHIRTQKGKTSVLFQQTYRRVPVWEARVHVVFHESGRIIAFGSDARRDLNMKASPGLESRSAFARARAWTGSQASGNDIRADLWIVPTGGTNRLAWRTVANDGAGTPARVSLIDAQDGTVLSSELFAFNSDVTGTVSGDTDWFNPCDGPVVNKLYPDQQVDLDNGGSGFTNTSGVFNISYPGTATNATFWMKGRYAEVSNYLAGPPTVTSFVKQVVSGTADLVWNNANSTKAERDIYYHVTLARNHLAGVIDFDFMDEEFNFAMKCRANEDIPGFNAYWNWDGTNDYLGFHRANPHAGVPYTNAGEMADMIYHEFGHSLTGHVYGGPGLINSQPNRSIHEGNSDVLAVLLTQDPTMFEGWERGVGGAICTSFIRTADNTLKYPDDYDYRIGPHDNGRIIAGVFWDIYEYLDALPGYTGDQARDATLEFWHYGRKLGMPLSFPDQLYWTYIADDDDGNLANGTPHSAAIDQGSTNHGFQDLASLFSSQDLFSHVSTSVLDIPKGVGVAWGDYDGDGDFDLFVAYKGTDQGQTSKLLRNDSGSFADATPAALALTTCNAGAWGDYDNDNDQDIALVRSSGGTLLRNDSGNFVNVTPGVLSSVVNQESVGWVDYDKDGDLDLSVASELLRNDGGSSFSQVTGQPLTGLNYVKAMAWTDYDRDGDSDVFFGRYHPGFPNDDSNKLIRNNGNGTFTDVTPTSLLMPEGCTGAAWGDYDNDGDPDLVATGYINDSESDPYTPQVSRLFRYDGGTTFTNIVDDDITRLEAASIEWGDYDNDGRLDLYGAGPLTNFLLRNDGGSGQSSFSNKSADPVWNSAFGLAAGWADYDLDGDIDLYLANLPSEDNPQSLNPKVEKGCRLFRNENSNGNTWLHVYLVGDQNNHDGVGARLKLLADTGTFYRQSDGGGGHGTQNSKLIEFGLGAATSVSALKVTWPNGEQTILGPIEELNTVIVAYEPTPPPPPGPMSVNLPISTRLLGGRPNPFRAATSIQFSLSGEAMPDLEVYDVAGRKIRSAGLGLLPAGVHEWNWDGRNNEGQRVSSGVYYARFRVGGVSESARLLLLR